MTTKTTQDPIDDVLPSPNETEFQVHQYFAKVLFDLLKTPDVEKEKEAYEAELEARKIKFLYDPEDKTAAIATVDGENIRPLITINAPSILEQMAFEHESDLKKTAEFFDGREYGNVITLEEAIELNKKGYALLVPNSDDQLRIYGIGEKAEKLEDQMIECYAVYIEEESYSGYYVPASKDKFMSVLDTEIMLNSFTKIVEVFGDQPIPAMYQMSTILDSDKGFVVSLSGYSDGYPVHIYEEGDMYGVGLLVELL